MTKYLTVCLFCMVTQANGQHSSVISYMAPMPILIEADLYIDTLGEKGSVCIVSPAIKIYRFPKDLFVDTDQSFSNGMPLKSNQLSDIEFRITLNSNIGPWKKMPPSVTAFPTSPYGGKLVDTLLEDQSQLLLELRQAKTHQLIQQNLLYRKLIAPQIKQFRQKATSDTVDNALKSRAIKNIPQNAAGFSNFPIGALVLNPGMSVDFLFTKTYINLDSSIEYRLTDENSRENSQWKISGHLLAIKNLLSNHRYLLELRYRGLNKTNTYQIQTLPYWYQKIWATILFIIIAILLFIGIPYRWYQYRIKMEKQKRHLVEQQLKTVQSQLNPHFVFNALSSIEELVSEGQNEKANEYLTDFSDIMRDTLRNSDLLFTSLSEDMDMLEKYIRIEQLRFGFDYSINLDDSLDANTIDFPPMLLQPSVENAVKHGVSGMGKDGHLSIQYERKVNDLQITILDNGMRKSKHPKPGNGKGMAFTKERMENLKALHKKEQLTYTVSHNEWGTKVLFTFQNWLS